MFPAFAIYQPQATSEQKTEIIFNERKLREGFLELDPTVLTYFREEQYRDKFENTDSIYLSLRLRELVKLWEKEISISSSITSIIENEYFKKIVSYGEAIVPSVLIELERNPSRLVWALNFITGRNISEKAISIEDASMLWVKWGKNIHLIA